MNSLNDIWASILEVLSRQLTPTSINTWFSDCAPVELEDGRLVTISFQRDSLLRLTVSGPEGKDILYLAPAWFDALDSADEDE